MTINQGFLPINKLNLRCFLLTILLQIIIILFYGLIFTNNPFNTFYIIMKDPSIVLFYVPSFVSLLILSRSIFVNVFIKKDKIKFQKVDNFLYLPDKKLWLINFKSKSFNFLDFDIFSQLTEIKQFSIIYSFKKEIFNLLIYSSSKKYLIRTIQEMGPVFEIILPSHDISLPESLIEFFNNRSLIKLGKYKVIKENNKFYDINFIKKDIENKYLLNMNRMVLFYNKKLSNVRVYLESEIDKTDPFHYFGTNLDQLSSKFSDSMNNFDENLVFFHVNKRIYPNLSIEEGYYLFNQPQVLINNDLINNQQEINYSEHETNLQDNEIKKETVNPICLELCDLFTMQNLTESEKVTRCKEIIKISKNLSNEKSIHSFLEQVFSLKDNNKKKILIERILEQISFRQLICTLNILSKDIKYSSNILNLLPILLEIKNPIYDGQTKKVLLNAS